IRCKEMPALMEVRSSRPRPTSLTNAERRTDEAATTMTCSGLSPLPFMKQISLRTCRESDVDLYQSASAHQSDLKRIAGLARAQCVLHCINVRQSSPADLNQNIAQKHTSFFRRASRLNMHHQQPFAGH